MKSREQIAHENVVARNFDILLIAESFGYAFKQGSRNLVCTNSNGLVIFKETNSYYDYYSAKGGTPIDFVMNERECSVKDAIEYINEMVGNNFIADNSFESRKVIQKDKKLSLPEKNDNHKRVYAYLRFSRNISHDVVSFMLHNHLVYESKDKHNAIFLGKDKDNVIKHAFVRGTISGVQYRGDVEGSDKEYGFSVVGEGSELIVFEAPIDLLSYMSIKPDNHAHLLALGMVEDAPIYKYIEEHTEIKNVALLLDNDKYGKIAMEKIKQNLMEHNLNVVENDVAKQMVEANVKDVNELLSSYTDGNVIDKKR